MEVIGGMCRLCGDLVKAADFQTAIEVFARNVMLMMGTKGSMVRLMNMREQRLDTFAVSGIGEDTGKDFNAEEDALEHRVMEEKKARWKEIRKGTVSIPVLAAPLVTEKRAVGVVKVFADEGHKFSDEEMEKLTMFAAFGSIVADRVRIVEEMNALIRISRSITSSLSVDEVIGMIVEHAVKILGMKASSIRLLDDTRKVLEVKAAYGLSREYLEKGKVEIEKSPVDRECLMCNIVTIEDVRKDGRLQYPDALVKEGVLALLSVPLSVRGAAIGVFRLYAPMPYQFSESEIDFASALACQGAVAIENARLYEHIRSEYNQLERDVWKWYDWGAKFPKI